MVTNIVQSLIKVCSLVWTALNISDMCIQRSVADKSILISPSIIKKVRMGAHTRR